TLAASLWGFRGPELGSLHQYFASPTAAASYFMARTANGNYELAAASIVITSLAAAVTRKVGIFIRQWGGWF
ncbi:AEC family transporter, partial [Pseudomonas syringae pv. tagetis]